MEANQKVGQAAGAVGGMTLFSRLLGFIRDLVIAMQFGASSAADAFFVAFRIPNVQRRILAEGAVTAAFIPVFSELRNDRGDKEAWAMTGNLFNILLAVLVTTTLALAVFAPFVITVFAPGFLDEPDKFDLAVLLTRWMAPYLLFIGLAVFCMGILNACKVFALPAATPALLNICMISAALFISPQLEEPILGLAFGVLVGGLLQFLCQVPEVMRRGFRFATSFKWKDSATIKIGKLMVPAILGLAVYEINMLVDTLLASLLPGGSISYLYYGNRLVQLPLGVFGVALGVAILPMLSDQAARKDLPEMIKTLAFGIRLILFITIPATVGLILLRFPIVNTLWERGEFSRVTTEGTAIALLYYSVGLCAFCGIKVIVPAFYSLQDTKTPAMIGIWSMVLNIVLNLILMGPMKHGGLALATSIAALFNVVLLIHFLRKRLGLLGGRKILVSTLKLVLASAVMGIVIYFFNANFFDPDAAIGIKLSVLTADVVLGVLCYGFLSRLMQNEELTFIFEMARKRRRGISS
ncbi:MAG: murein biosynthesis integral membrane protein MurJ [Nitrospinae bacterium]|nr:murein biosynthesis integral membrane protein MurJ [Nitrospinota bacterium]